jgi:WD40 repeat protein
MIASRSLSTPNGKIIATGELGPKPSIFVWEAATGNMLFQLKKGLAKGIDNLQYSQSGKYLVGTMMDDDHTMVVYDVEQGLRNCSPDEDWQGRDPWHLLDLRCGVRAGREQAVLAG